MIPVREETGRKTGMRGKGEKKTRDNTEQYKRTIHIRTGIGIHISPYLEFWRIAIS